jgi:hypothetical protein
VDVARLELDDRAQELFHLHGVYWRHEHSLVI